MIVSGLSYPAVHRRPVQAWEEHRPDLDTSAMQIVAQINAITAALNLAVEQAYEGSGLTSADMGLLVLLRHSTEAVTAARLAERLNMSRAEVSKTLTRLENGESFDANHTQLTDAPQLCNSPNTATTSSTNCSRASPTPTANCCQTSDLTATDRRTTRRPDNSRAQRRHGAKTAPTSRFSSLLDGIHIIVAAQQISYDCSVRRWRQILTEIRCRSSTSPRTVRASSRSWAAVNRPHRIRSHLPIRQSLD